MGTCCGQFPAQPRFDNDDTSVAGSTGVTTQVSLAKAHHSKTPSSRKLTQHSVMTKVAMQFPKIRKSFMECHAVFHKNAGDKEWVPKSGLKPILNELGASEDVLSDADIDKLVATANLDGDDKIDFKEFLIAAAIGVFLNEDIDEKEQNERFVEMKSGFVVIKSAFREIDVDDSGEIDFEELKGAFLSMRQDSLIMERLKELDITRDKQVTFPEFVFGMCSWVGLEDDDDLHSTGGEVSAPQSSADSGGRVSDVSRET